MADSSTLVGKVLNWGLRSFWYWNDDFLFLKWFLDSIKAVISDKGFQLRTPPAESARETATKLITFSQTAEGHPKFSAFAEELFILLGPVFASKPNKSLKLQHEQMWCTYHSLRTSSTFMQRWSTFILATTGELWPSSILVQYITDQFFHRLIQCRFSLAAEHVTPAQQQPLTYEERNALHYTAGAVCCTLKSVLLSPSIRPKVICWLE